MSLLLNRDPFNSFLSILFHCENSKEKEKMSEDDDFSRVKALRDNDQVWSTDFKAIYYRSLLLLGWIYDRLG